jgi:AcrR family transcriptional regulator
MVETIPMHQGAAVAVRRPGRPRRSDAEQAARRIALLYSAMAAVRRLGPDVSVEEMAAAAGVSKPVLHDEFGSKVGIAEAIALEVARRVEGELIDRLAAQAEIDPADAVRTIIESLMTMVDEEPEIHAYLVRTLRADDRGLLDNALVRTLHERIRLLTRLMVPDADPDVMDLLTYGSFGFVFAAVESWQVSRRLERQAVLDTLVPATLGVLASAARPGSDG